MFFGPLPTREALGCRLAHSLAATSGRIRKGRRLDENDVRALLDAGHEHVVVARPGPDDDDEDVAAARVAATLLGPGLRASSAATGRVNLFAERAGLLLVGREALLGANRVDEGITLATLAENLPVAEGRLVATIKIIPFAVARAHVDAVVDALSGSAALSLRPMRPRTATLVQTTSASLSTAALEKTRRVTEERLAAREIRLLTETRCAHETSALVAALADATARGPELVLVAGATAIGDRRDVVPAALELAGGRVERFGLPVDPGNLLLVGRLGDAIVLGLPGCARSPRDNGLDRVLDRVAADVPLDADWLDSLAIGGLLGEIVERPAPRVVATAASPAAAGVPGTAAPGSLPSADERQADAPISAASSGADDERRVDGPDGTDGPNGTDGTGRTNGAGVANERDERGRVAAVVLAAGRSRRAGDVNKLLYPVAGEPMLRRVLRRVLASGIDDVVVVTGHERTAVEAAVADLGVRLRHNPAHARGMGSSLARGLGAVADHDAVLVCLGDMPDVDPTTLERLVATWRAARSDGDERVVVVPTRDGRRGNPVLIGRVFFDLLLALDGDVGARDVVRAHPEAVREVAVEDGAILLDHDTLAELRTLDDR